MHNSYCANDEGTYRSDDPCYLYDHPGHSHENCCCGKRATLRRCAHPDCNKRFKPSCRAAIFCCYGCFFKSGLEPYWDYFCAAYDNSIEKLKKYLAKQLYRKTKKGKDSRRKEYDKRNEKRAEKPKLERETCPVPGEKMEDSPPVLPPSKANPKRCRRPGCLKWIDLPFHVEVKYFCSVECKKTFRNIRKILETAYKATQCPCVLLVLAFLISL